MAQLALDQAGVKQAQAALDEARINLAYTDITSPVDGVVVSRNVDVGQTVAASFQTPTLFLIAQDLTKMQVDANVSESDIGDVRDGQPASFTVDAYPGRQFHGTVMQVRNAPITVQNVVTYDVVIAVDNPDLALKPGMTATVAIITAARDDVLRVPLRALRSTPTAQAGAAPGRRPRRRRRRRSGAWHADGTLRARRRADRRCATTSTPRSTAGACSRRRGRGGLAPRLAQADSGRASRARRASGSKRLAAEDASVGAEVSRAVDFIAASTAADGTVRPPA